jgi:hypothetical protein
MIGAESVSVEEMKNKARPEERRQRADRALRKFCSRNNINIDMEKRRDVLRLAAGLKVMIGLADPPPNREVFDFMLNLARGGDRMSLANYIRAGHRITPEMRSFLADVLLGVAKRPRKTSAALAPINGYLLLEFVERARNRGDKDVPQQAEKMFGRTWRHLQKILATARADNKAQVVVKHRRKLDIFRLCVERLNEHAKERNWGVIRYAVNATALNPHTLP